MKAFQGVFLLFVAFGLYAQAETKLPSADATPGPRPSTTPEAPATPSPTPDSKPSPTPTPALTPEAAAGVTPTPVPTSTPTPTPVPGPVLKTTELLIAPTPEPKPAPNEGPELSLDRAGAQTLTLEQSVQYAIGHASDVMKAENDVHAFGARLLQAYGQFLPNLIGTANYGYQTGRIYSTAATPILTSGTGTNAAFALAADFNIFNGLSDFANLKSSILKKEASDLTVTRAKQQIALDVAQSYLQVILDYKLVSIAKKNLQASQERERLLKEQTDVGAKNLSDLFRQQAQTSQDQFNLLTAQNRTRFDQITLLRKLRVDIDQNYHFIEPPLIDEKTRNSIPDEETLVKQGIAERVDLKAFNDVANANDWEVRSAASTYFPKIDLLGSLASDAHYLQNQTVNGADVLTASQNTLVYQLPRQIEWTVGVSLTWSIFDRFLTNQNIQRARAVANDSEIDAGDRKLQVQGEVREAYGNYLTALQQLAASKKGFEAAQKAYEVMDGRYSVGAASFLDLITAQSVLVQAESTNAQALVNYQLQDQSLAFAVGNLKI